jgi:ATP-dependent DNA helicase RecG (EC 3.6.1.-)
MKRMMALRLRGETYNSEGLVSSLGARQSGLALLRFADFEADAKWLSQAQALAAELRQTQPEVAQRHKDRWMQSREAFLNG